MCVHLTLVVLQEDWCSQLYKVTVIYGCFFYCECITNCWHHTYTFTCMDVSICTHSLSLTHMYTAHMHASAVCMKLQTCCPRTHLQILAHRQTQTHTCSLSLFCVHTHSCSFSLAHMHACFFFSPR